MSPFRHMKRLKGLWKLCLLKCMQMFKNVARREEGGSIGVCCLLYRNSVNRRHPKWKCSFKKLTFYFFLFFFKGIFQKLKYTVVDKHLCKIHLFLPKTKGRGLQRRTSLLHQGSTCVEPGKAQGGWNAPLWTHSMRGVTKRSQRC